MSRPDWFDSLDEQIKKEDENIKKIKVINRILLRFMNGLLFLILVIYFTNLYKHILFFQRFIFSPFFLFTFIILYVILWFWDTSVNSEFPKSLYYKESDNENLAYRIMKISLLLYGEGRDKKEVTFHASKGLKYLRNLCRGYKNIFLEGKKYRFVKVIKSYLQKAPRIDRLQTHEYDEINRFANQISDIVYNNYFPEVSEIDKIENYEVVVNRYHYPPIKKPYLENLFEKIKSSKILWIVGYILMDFILSLFGGFLAFKVGLNYMELEKTNAYYLAVVVIVALFVGIPTAIYHIKKQ